MGQGDCGELGEKEEICRPFCSVTFGLTQISIGFPRFRDVLWFVNMNVIDSLFIECWCFDWNFKCVLAAHDEFANSKWLHCGGTVRHRQFDDEATITLYNCVFLPFGRE